MSFDVLEQALGPAWPVVWTLAKIVAIALPLILCVAYLTLAPLLGTATASTLSPSHSWSAARAAPSPAPWPGRW